MKTKDMIKKVRAFVKMSQLEFGEAIGCQQPMVSKFERGTNSPSIALAKKIVRFAKSKKMKITLSDIFPDEFE